MFRPLFRGNRTILHQLIVSCRADCWCHGREALASHPPWGEIAGASRCSMEGAGAVAAKRCCVVTSCFPDITCAMQPRRPLDLSRSRRRSRSSSDWARACRQVVFHEAPPQAEQRRSSGKRFVLRTGWRQKIPSRTADRRACAGMDPSLFIGTVQGWYRREIRETGFRPPLLTTGNAPGGSG